MDGKIPPEILAAIPAEFACRHKVVPLQLTDDVLKVGLCQPDNEQLLSDLEFLSGKPIEPVALSEAEMMQALQEVYGVKSFNFLSPTTEPCPAGLAGRGEFQVVEKERDASDDGKLRKEVDELSNVALVNKIITDAIDQNASDIHVEAYEQQFRVRYRIDGSLQEISTLPLEKKPAIISRLKIMAELDIAEKRRPQDGRIRVKRHDKVIDIRVSTLPTDFGEKVVLRILNKSQLNLDIENRILNFCNLQKSLRVFS